MKTRTAQKLFPIIAIASIIIIMLACSIVPASPPPGTPTQAIQATDTDEPTREPDATATSRIIMPTLSVQDQIQSSNILLYEDSGRLSPWIKQTLDRMGLSYTNIGDKVGDFMTELLSGKKWDLIIVGAESKSAVQGDFWDIIVPQVLDKNTALIAEVWYLDRTVNGKVKNLLTSCGVEYQQDYRLAQSIYILQPDHPIFNDPNPGLSLITYSRYWKSKAGDVIRLIPGSNSATLLAGEYHDRESDYGLMAACLDGRVVLQTFSNHDYHEDTIKALWENYITYVLKNHYKTEH
ncbi:MAG: hypothetical protein WA821_22820 [Anaerolineales bacterium]